MKAWKTGCSLMNPILAITLLIAMDALPQNLMWQKSHWAVDNPLTGTVESFQQHLSGEDWFNGHSVSRTTAGAVDGVIMAGYSDFVNYFIENANSCPTQPGWRKLSSPYDCKHFESSSNRRGTMLTALTKFTQQGTEIWGKVYGIAGEYNAVIQTTDGQYLAVGYSQATRDFKNNVNLAYNPKAGVANDYFNAQSLGCGPTSIVQMMLVSKIDRDGNVIWSNLYGVPQYADGVVRALNAHGNAYAAVELSDGKFLIGGLQEDPDYTQQGSAQNGNPALPTERAAILKIDGNGKYEWGEYLLSTGSNSAIHDFEKVTTGGTTSYFAAGTEGYYNWGGTMEYQPSITAYYRKKAFLAKYDPSGSHADDEGTFTWRQHHGYDPLVKQNMRVTDIALNKDGQILFPVIRNTHDLCFSWNCKGDGVLYVVNPSDGSAVQEVLLTDPNNASDKFKAYDLRLGVTGTANGGFAIVTAIQPNAPLVQGTGGDIPNYGCTLGTELKYFETDAYVAKYSKSGVKMWSLSFDAGTAAPSPSGSRYLWSYPHAGMLDLKNQECLYSITEATDNSLIISGNNSANFDDNYFAKIFGGNITAPLSILFAD
jgi:hypothetical protein